MNNKKYIVGNWKMNLNAEQVNAWLSEFNKLQTNIFNNVDIIVAPSHVFLEKVAMHAKSLNVNVAAQDVSEFEKGTHTGQVSALQIKEFCTYSIVGHSERKESPNIVMQKIDRCLENNITPIVCFENVETAKKYLKDGVILAYEDPENISHGGVYKAKDTKEIHETFKYLKDTLGYNTKIIYGGSTNKNMVVDLAQIDLVDGALPGNASLDPKHFFEIIKAFTK